MSTNGTASTTQHQKPKPVGDLPPAPLAAVKGATNGTMNGTSTTGKGKKEPPPPDPAAMYESVRNRIAALEEEEVHGEEEDRRVGQSTRSKNPRITIHYAEFAAF